MLRLCSWLQSAVICMLANLNDRGGVYNVLAAMSVGHARGEMVLLVCGIVV